MAPTSFVQPPPDLAATFKPDMFKGKVLFCTGGGSGICKAMTESIMHYGADAVVLGRKIERLTQAAEELSKKTGRRCLPIQADVRQPKQLHDAAAKAVAELGRIDFVICGAAGNFLAPISGMSENAFRTVIEIDTLGTYNTIKATIPHVRATHGAYIHVSATLHYRGKAFQVHVSAAKAAVDATSAVLAVEEGPHGVRSNVIAPGPIAGTEGMDRLSRKGADGASVRIDSSLPVGRLGDVRDIAGAGVYLFSPAASFITGQVLVVDGGHRHTDENTLPYPQSVLDPSSVEKLIRAKM